MTARDFFDAVAVAAKERERTRSMLARMEAMEKASGSGLGGRVSGGGSSDPMARVDARIDREAVWHRRMTECEAMLNEAEAVIYGADGRAGVALALGSVYADVLWWRYVAAEKWPVVAAMVGKDRKTCTIYRNTALDYVDSVGLEAAARGEEA